MLRTVRMALLFIVAAFLVFSTSSYGVSLDAPVSASSGEAVTERTLHGQRTRRQSSLSLEPVEVFKNVYMEDIDSENQTFTPVPMIVLKRGQTYRVEQRYKDTKPATSRAGFSKWEPTDAHPKGFWTFQDEDTLDWSKRSGDNQGEGVLKADDYPSGKCLISFWSHSEYVNTDEQGSRHRYVPYQTWSKVERDIQGRKTVVFSFEFKDKYTTATVTLYRLP